MIWWEVSRGWLYAEKNFINNKKTTEEGDMEIPSSEKTPISVGRLKLHGNHSGHKQEARILIGGGVPRHALSFKMYENPVANLFCREIMRAPTIFLPGEWDRHIPKRRKVSMLEQTKEWKKIKVQETLIVGNKVEESFIVPVNKPSSSPIPLKDKV
jgi:hypothetical protein